MNGSWLFRLWKEKTMGAEEHVYRITEVVGSSSEGVDAAIRNGVSKAAETIRNIGWFEAIETRGFVADDKVAYVQVTMKIGFRVD
ncbi:MAG: dodecin family protein [Tomitella sp.]|nr:dodecin family protein [Tomitella sp.]